MIHTVQPRHGAFWLARLLRPAAWAEQIFLAERLAAVEASAQQRDPHPSSLINLKLQITNKTQIPNSKRLVLSA
jgi:hypothetical protein